MQKRKSESFEELRIDEELGAFFEILHTAASEGRDEVPVVLGGVAMVLGLPPLGEGDNSVVYPLKSVSLDLPDASGSLCLKIAKQFTVCRSCLIKEQATTGYFLVEDIAVPRIHFMDPFGRFAVKDMIEGESVTSLYMRFDTFPVRTQSIVLKGLDQFLSQLMDLFSRRPECKVSISPNNIYALCDGERLQLPVRFVLIDPGPSPNKRYDGFNFDKYWNEMLPNRISKYRRTGYLQWIVPREVSEAEYAEAKEFEVFRDLSDQEVGAILDIATTVDFDPGQTIMKEGTIGENFYLLLEGEVLLRKGQVATPGSWGIKLQSGAVLGEMGFLLGVPRSMTVVAAEHCKMVAIQYDDFVELLEKQVVAPYKLLRNIAVILAERLYKLDQLHQKLTQSIEHYVSLGMK